MSNIQEECISSCIHDNPKNIIKFEFENEKFTKSLCQNCINFIKNSKYAKIISEESLR